MKLFRVFLVICGLCFSAHAIDREAFTFTKYDLDVRIEPEQQRLEVRGKITLRNDSVVPQKNLSLQISSSLDWRSIQLDGKPVQFVSQPYTSDIDHTGALSEAIVTLAQAVPPKGTIELEIGYEGVIVQDATRLMRIGLPADVARHSDWDEIGKFSSAVRGAGHVAWYPVAMESANLSEGNSVSESLGRWRTREQMVSAAVEFNYSEVGGERSPLVLCTGRSIGGGIEDLGRFKNVTARCFFDSVGAEPPSFAAGHYLSLDRLLVQVDYFAEREAAAKDFALATEKAAPFVNDWFGPPRERVRVLELADEQASPFESGADLMTPLGHVDPALVEVAAVHPLAHAAFSSPREWIEEGAAHFAQAAYREKQAGRQAALDLLAVHRDEIIDAEKTSLKTPADESLINSSRDEFFRGKAAYVWWMLRDMAGEAALKKALGAYHFEDDKGPAYMQRLIEATSKKDLEWFFDDWVYRDRGLPDFRVASVFPRETLQHAYMVTVTVENLGDAGAEVPVTVKTESGDVTQRVEVRGKSKNSVRIQVSSFPQEVVVNDGSVPETDMSNNSFTVTK